MQMLASADIPQLRELCGGDEFFWLDLDDPAPETLGEVGEVLKLHPLAVEDTQEFGQRPKVDMYEEQLLIVYFGAAEVDGQPVPVEVHLHISDRFVVTVHRKECLRFSSVREVLDRRPPRSEHDFVFRVIDALTDSVLDVLESVAAEVDEHEANVFHRPRARDRDRMAALRRSLGALRRVLAVQRQQFDRLVEHLNTLTGLERDANTYWRDVADHLWRAVDELEAARESLQGMLDTYTNEVQERLTIVATIFLPLTVVTGFFGQNFNWLISHIGSAWAFWGIGVGVLLVSALVIYGWLIRSGLYQRSQR